MLPNESGPRRARDAFLRMFREDLEQDSVRDEAEYRALFPEHQDEISAELAFLEDGPLEGLVATVSPRDDEDGHDHIGPYRILEEIGRGGQAVVYLAEHVTLKRRAALKVLQLGAVVLHDSSDLRRFRREAEVTSRLDHPGICSVYETGEDGGQAWIAMRHVQGETLAARVERHGQERTPSGVVPLPSSSDSDVSAEPDPEQAPDREQLMRVVAFVEKAARALHFAHEHGLIHRDIKPGNIMVDTDGGPVLLDFGLAKDVTALDGTLTMRGDLVGTPYYMSPEQLLAQRVTLDRRTDVYSLGVTLYECLTLRRPFEAPTRDALYQQIIAGELPDPRSVNPKIPRDLANVLQTALDRDRGRRYQTALDLAEDLRRIRVHEPIRAKPLPVLLRARRWTQRHPVVATLLLVLVAGLGVASWVVADRSERLRRTQAADLVGKSEFVLADDPDLALRFALRAVQLDDTVETRAQVGRVLVEPFPFAKRTHPGDERREFVQCGYSTDGNRLWATAYGAGGRVRPGGNPGIKGSLVVWDRSGRPVTEIEREMFPTGVLFAPGADHFVLVAADGSLEFLDETGEVKNSVPGNWRHTLRVAKYSENVFYRVGEALWLLHDDGSCESRDYTGEKVATFRPMDGPVAAIRASRKGDEVVLATKHGTLELRNRAGEILRRCPLGNKLGTLDLRGIGMMELHYQPLERRIAFSARARRAALRVSEHHVEMWDVDSERHWRLEFTEPCHQVRFSPAGDRLLTAHADRYRLWTPDGEPIAGAFRPGLSFPKRPARKFSPPEWFSAAGDRVITTFRDFTAALWNRDGQLVRWLELDATSEMITLQFTEDPPFLVVAQAGRIFVFDLDGNRVGRLDPHGHRSLGSGVVRFALSPSGDELFSVSLDTGKAALWRWIDPALPQMAAHRAPIRGLAIAGDGRIATASDDGWCRVWSPTGKLLHELPGGGVGYPRRVAFSRDGRYLCTGHDDGRVLMWEPRTEERKPIWQRSKDSRITGVAFSQDGGLVAAGAMANQGVTVRRGSDGSEVGSQAAGIDNYAVRFASDDSQLWVAGGRQGVFAFSVSRQRGASPALKPLEGVDLRHPVRPGLRAGRLYVFDVRLAPDESTLAACFLDGSIELWRRDGDTWSLDWKKRGHQAIVWTIAFSPKGDLLVSASGDGTALIWDLEGKVKDMLRGPAPLRAAEFTPNGDKIVTVGEDGFLRTWFADSVEMLRHARSIPIRDLTADERGRYAELLGGG